MIKTSQRLGKTDEILNVLVKGVVVSVTCTLLSAQEPTSTPKSGSLRSESDKASASLPPNDLGEYVISPGDVLGVTVFDVPELSSETVVSREGTIILALLPKPVKAVGLTPGQLAQAVAEDYRRLGRLSHPQVFISVKQSQARSTAMSVAMEGAFKNPQLYEVMGRIKLLDLITRTGGLTDDAADTLTIYRGKIALHALAQEARDPSKVLTVELRRLLDGSDASLNIDVFPGDRLRVPHAGVFYVLGEVNRPGTYNLKSAQEEITVLEALAIAGDVTSVANTKKAMIIRKDPQTPRGRGEIALDLRGIFTGRSADVRLQANDILYVPASGRKRAIHGVTTFGLGVASPVTTGLIIYRR